MERIAIHFENTINRMVLIMYSFVYSNAIKITLQLSF